MSLFTFLKSLVVSIPTIQIINVRTYIFIYNREDGEAGVPDPG